MRALGDIVIGLLLFTGFGICWFFRGFIKLREKRLIENIPTSTIRGLALGLVELAGKAEIGNSLKAPLTQKECVYYSYLVERWERDGRNSSWTAVAKGDSSFCPFFLNDGTGRVQVLPKSAEVVLPVSYECETGRWGNVSPEIAEILERQKISSRGLFGETQPIRCREWRIAPGQSVYIVGTARMLQESPPDLREDLTNRLRELKQNKEAMAEIDLNKDGVVSVEEWDCAVEGLETHQLKTDLQTASTDELADIIVSRGKDEKTFVISNSSQTELLERMSWQAAGGIWGGAAVIIATLAYLLFHYTVMGGRIWEWAQWE